MLLPTSGEIIAVDDTKYEIGAPFRLAHSKTLLRQQGRLVLTGAFLLGTEPLHKIRPTPRVTAELHAKIGRDMLAGTLPPLQHDDIPLEPRVGTVDWYDQDRVFLRQPSGTVLVVPRFTTETVLPTAAGDVRYADVVHRAWHIEPV